MTRLASKSVPQPTKRGLRPERQTNMSALPYVSDDRVASCKRRTGPQRTATFSALWSALSFEEPRIWTATL